METEDSVSSQSEGSRRKCVSYITAPRPSKGLQALLWEGERGREGERREGERERGRERERGGGGGERKCGNANKTRILT